jgi:hypothetical protein
MQNGDGSAPVPGEGGWLVKEQVLLLKNRFFCEEPSFVEKQVLLLKADYFTSSSWGVEVSLFSGL